MSVQTDEHTPPGVERPNGARRRWTWPLLVVGGATFLGLLGTLQSYLAWTSAGRPMPFWEIARYWLPDYWLWAALTPAIVWLARRFPIRGRAWKGRLAIHVVIGPLFGAFELVLGGLVIDAMGEFPSGYEGLWDYFAGVFTRYAIWGILIYGLIVAAAHAYDLYREVQRRERQTAELEGRLARSRLRALKMQLQPHFLFNTLHSIGMLVRMERSEDALGMLTGLSDLLRQSLDRADEQEVSLGEELEFLGRYLDVEQIRFHDRLEVAYDVDPRTLSAEVPNLILQPLVENAVRHGVEPHAGPRHVTVRSWIEAGELMLEVADDGLPPGRELPRRRRHGVGLANVRERLGRLYGGAARLDVRAREEGGVVARIRLPFRRLSAASEEVSDVAAPTEEESEDGPDPTRAAAHPA